MKKTLLIMVMAFALLLTQCRKPEVKFPSPVAPEGTTVSMTVTAGPGSKTDITTAGVITWSSGDKLYVGDGSKYVGYLTIVSGEGTPTGTFSGDVTLTGITEGTEKEFGFFYLGNAKDYSTELTKGTSTEVAVSFATQEIYNNSGNLENASKHHVGYGSAKGTVKDGIVTGINVTLVSKVALARFSFTETAGKGEYSGPLALSGTGICNKMTVSFASSTGFRFTRTEGTIRLRGSHSERYVMLVPVGADSEILSFGGGASGTTTLENGIEANKFYGRDGAIGVEVTPQEYVDLGLPSRILWAKCNLGAEHPYDYGDYYQWGATETWYEAGHAQEEPQAHWKFGYSDGYTWAHYPHTNGIYSNKNKAVFTKYVPQDLADTYGYEGYWDDKTVLDAGDDAATQEWGSDWRMPTGGESGEWQELASNTYMKWVYDYDDTGVAGIIVYKVKNELDKGLSTFDYNDNPLEPYWVTKNQDFDDAVLQVDYSLSDVHMFLPAAGQRRSDDLDDAGEEGNYWSSSADAEGVRFAGWFNFYAGMHPYPENTTWLYYGQSVRAVRAAH